MDISAKDASFLDSLPYICTYLWYFNDNINFLLIKVLKSKIAFPFSYKNNCKDRKYTLTIKGRHT